MKEMQDAGRSYDELVTNQPSVERGRKPTHLVLQRNAEDHREDSDEQDPWPLFLVAQSSSVERLDVLVRVRSLCGGIWIHSWKKPATCRTCGKIFSRPDVSLSDFLPARGEKKKRKTAVKMPLLPCLDVPAVFLGVIRRVNSRHRVVKIQSLRIARSLTNPRSMEDQS